MYHPAIYQYIERYRADYNEQSIAPETVLETLRCSLNSPEEIMEINWVTMGKVLDVPSGRFSRVYQFGWKESVEAQRLYDRLKEIVAGVVLDKPLEDYL